MLGRWLPEQGLPFGGMRRALIGRRGAGWTGAQLVDAIEDLLACEAIRLVPTAVGDIVVEPNDGSLTTLLQGVA
jgi:hypothetical protein